MFESKERPGHTWVWFGFDSSWSLPAWPSPKAPKLIPINPTKNNEVYPSASLFVPALPHRSHDLSLSTPLSRPPPDFERRTPPNLLVSRPLSLTLPSPSSALFFQKAFDFHSPPASHSRVIRADDFIASIGGLSANLPPIIIFNRTLINWYVQELSLSSVFFVVSFWFLASTISWLG